MISFRRFNLSIKKAQLNGIRCLHHSPTHGKFYTNRFYVKKCSKCKSLNSLTLISCFNCSSALTDSDIRFRSLDHICEVSNSRKNVGTTKLFTAIVNTNINAPRALPISTDIKGSSDKNDINSLVLYRCFDFTIMANRNPSSFIHISAFPNGTFYDIKNFRKSHIDLISKMRDRCVLAFKDILSGKVELPGIDTVILDKVRTQAAERGNDQSRRVNEALNHVIWGFNYPNTHCHVDMHALLPPITSFNLFKSPFFYPLEKVLGDLRNFGRVRNYSPSQIRHMNEFDEVVEEIRKSDRHLREQFAIW